jgi:hypothetical protein
MMPACRRLSFFFLIAHTPRRCSPVAAMILPITPPCATSPPMPPKVSPFDIVIADSDIHAHENVSIDAVADITSRMPVVGMIWHACRSVVCRHSRRSIKKQYRSSKGEDRVVDLLPSSRR